MGEFYNYGVDYLGEEVIIILGVLLGARDEIDSESEKLVKFLV